MAKVRPPGSPKPDEEGSARALLVDKYNYEFHGKAFRKKRQFAKKSLEVDIEVLERFNALRLSLGMRKNEATTEALEDWIAKHGQS